MININYEILLSYIRNIRSDNFDLLFTIPK